MVVKRAQVQGVTCLIVNLAAIACLLLSRGSQAQQPSNVDIGRFAVDGLSLQGRVRTDSAIYGQYGCALSDQFRGFTYCKRVKTEARSARKVTTTTTILHEADGSVSYVNRFVEPTFFKAEEVEEEIDQLSNQFRLQPRRIEIQEGSTYPKGLIVTWGSLQLSPLIESELATLRNDGSVTRGILVDYLGDYTRSAKAGLPVFSIQGGAGYVWSASFDKEGRGKLRVLAINALRLNSSRSQQDTISTASQVSRDATAPKIVDRSPSASSAEDVSSLEKETPIALNLLRESIKCPRSPYELGTAERAHQIVERGSVETSDESWIIMTTGRWGIVNPKDGPTFKYYQVREIRAEWKEISAAASSGPSITLTCSAGRKCLRHTIVTDENRKDSELFSTKQIDVKLCSTEAAENAVVAIQSLLDRIGK